MLGRKIYVYTDHKNPITQKELDRSRADRWRIMLLEYDVELSHIAGKDNLMTGSAIKIMRRNTRAN